VCLFDPVDVASEKLVKLKFWCASEVAYSERLIPPKSVGRILIELKVTARPLLSTLEKIGAIMFIYKIMHIRIISISANYFHF
jgi:hypothetical protein